MRAVNGETLHAEVASVLDWWSLAGVTDAVGEAPRDWLAPPPPAAAPVTSPHALPATTPLPDTLEAFSAWLAGDGDPALLGPAERRLPPAGPADASLMLLIDMPTADDLEAGALLSGKAGVLADAMLAAIGLTRDAVRLAALLPARPAGGRIDRTTLSPLADISRRHVALARPRRLLVLGQAACEALAGEGHGRARGRIHDIDGVPAVISFAPTALVGAPAAMKAAAWADLLLLPSDRT